MGFILSIFRQLKRISSKLLTRSFFVLAFLVAIITIIISKYNIMSREGFTDFNLHEKIYVMDNVSITEVLNIRGKNGAPWCGNKTLARQYAEKFDEDPVHDVWFIYNNKFTNANKSVGDFIIKAYAKTKEGNVKEIELKSPKEDGTIIDIDKIFISYATMAEREVKNGETQKWPHEWGYEMNNTNPSQSTDINVSDVNESDADKNEIDTKGGEEVNTEITNQGVNNTKTKKDCCAHCKSLCPENNIQCLKSYPSCAKCQYKISDVKTMKEKGKANPINIGFSIHVHEKKVMNPFGFPSPSDSLQNLYHTRQNRNTGMFTQVPNKENKFEI